MKSKTKFLTIITFISVLIFSCTEDDKDELSIDDQENNSEAVVSAIAGTGNSGDTDGEGLSASFTFPCGLAIDDAGNIYVADEGNHKIRKITPSGIVSNLAGSGIAGAKDGISSDASFWGPTGVAVDVSGNVYVADPQINKIRKITPSGVVSTLAGSGFSGSVDGNHADASFSKPVDVAVDKQGNVYVADQANHKIRKIALSGVVSTFAGSGSRGDSDGTAFEASFSDPASVAVDKDGNVYVFDQSNRKVKKITPSGVVSTIAGSGSRGSSDGTGLKASFDYADGITVDASGNIYIADDNNNKIRKLSASGVVTTLAGSGNSGDQDGIGSSSTFNNPIDVAVDGSGNVYVADKDNHLIRKIETN